MKNPKLLLIAIMVSSIFMGCKKDDDEIIVEPTTVKLLKKEVHTGRDNWTDTYNYEGSKLTSITTLFDGETENYNFTYDGDKIIKITYPNTQGEENITYTGDLLTKSLRKDNYFEYFNTYYEYNGTVLKSYYRDSKDARSSLSYPRRYDFAYTWSGNNVSQRLVKDSASPTNIRTYTYTYDDKKSPYTILNKYFKLMYDDPNYDYVSTNNMLTAKITNSASDAVTNLRFQYTYDEEGYPTKVEEYNTADNSLRETTTFEYIKVTL